jgi:plastocyanin
VVKAKGKSIPSAKQDSASLLKQIKADVLTAKGLAKAKVPAKTVSLGVSGPRGVELFNMFPASLSVSTGTVVTFKMSKDTFETHTATFGPKATLTTLAKGFQGGAVFPPAALFASDPAQPVTESATSHGNGFANTGALDQDSATPTVPASGQVKFTQAGTYHFICVIHPQMQGTIVVK